MINGISALSPVLTFILLILSALSVQASNVEERFNSFCGGRIVSSNDEYAIYNIVDGNSVKYGMCRYDSLYSPTFSLNSSSITTSSGKSTSRVINSKTYSILPPVFDKIQPASEGVIAVCKNKKWAYVNVECNYLTAFSFDAAMPPKNGIFKVMLNKDVCLLDSAELHEKYPNKDAVCGNDDIMADLTEQLLNEGQYDMCISIANKFIESKKKPGVANLTPSEVLNLIRVQSAASAAQNQAMATTMHPRIEELYPGAFKSYQSIKINNDNSFLSNSPQIAHSLVELIFTQIRNSNPELYQSLKNVESLVGMSEYKRAVTQYEDLLGHDSHEDVALVKLLYISLLHLAGDFERYNIEICRLSQNNADEISNPLLRIAAEAFSNRNSTAIQLIKNLQSRKLSKSDQFLLYALQGKIYSYSGLQKEAINSYKKAIDLSSAISNKNFNPVIDVLAAACLAAYNINDADLQEYIDKFLRQECLNDTRIFTSLNTLQLSKEWGFSRFRINQLINHFISSDNKKCKEAAFKLALFEKSILHDQQLDWHQLANNSNNSQVKSLFARYMELRSKYSGIDIYNIDEDYSPDFIEMMNIESKIKSNLYTAMPDMFDFYFGNISERIANKLDKNSLAIDFFEYKKDNNKLLGAWVITSSAKAPSFHEITDINKLSAYDPSDESSIIESYAHNGNLIWNALPIENYSTIYFSPSTYLNNKGIEYFEYEKKPLCISRDTHRVSSVLNIPEIANDNVQLQNVALYGGLEYGDTFVSSTRGGIRSGFLKYSLKEVNEIEHLLGDIAAIKKFTGTKGTPATFKELQYISPDIIHLATHGYQYSPKTVSNFQQRDRFDYYKQNTDLEDEDWLLSSTGLYLSNDQSVTDSINNIMLAREVALCRFKDTALVVLSACNTSDGETSSGYDYIIGLNYALQKARVQNIITSLWNVYDDTTYQFMVSMYQKIPDSSIHNAFLTTVREFWEQHKSHPKVWSSFIMIQNPSD